MASVPSLDEFFTEEEFQPFAKLETNRMYRARIYKKMKFPKNEHETFVIEVKHPQTGDIIGTYWAPSTFESTLTKERINISNWFWLGLKPMKESKSTGRMYHAYKLGSTSDPVRKLDFSKTSVENSPPGDW